jgi:AraC family transcriptional regulator
MFEPRMHNLIEGFSVLAGPNRRFWDGIAVDLWDVQCASYAGGHYLSKDPRLFILLDHKGIGWPCFRNEQKRHARREISRISYIPAQQELWLDFVDIQRVQHLDIHFDTEALLRRFGDSIEPRHLDSANLMITDERMMALSHLIAEEVTSPNPFNDLYGEGLILSLLTRVLNLPKLDSRQRTTLAPWQLRRAKDYIDMHCLRAIRLEELAEITGLSQSHFSHSFKASTGSSPHTWQMNARISRAKVMLTHKEASLTDIATETGFSDHSHFSRVFKCHQGISPSQWRKQNLAF